LQDHAGLIDINIDLVLAAAEHPPEGSCEVKHGQQHEQKQNERERSQRAAPASVRMHDMLFYNPIGHLKFLPSDSILISPRLQGATAMPPAGPRKWRETAPYSPAAYIVLNRSVRQEDSGLWRPLLFLFGSL
jgi:hypothetical protein